jgi:hypothetical protein
MIEVIERAERIKQGFVSLWSLQCVLIIILFVLLITVYFLARLFAFHRRLYLLSYERNIRLVLTIGEDGGFMCIILHSHGKF